MAGMRVVELREFGGSQGFVLSERPVPEPGRGEVRIRVEAASFNPVDRKIRLGRFGGSLPMVLGHDAAGRVEKLGEGVEGVAPGDPVWAFLGGPQSNGAYAEQVVVPAELVGPRPRRLSVEEAAAMPVVGLTALQAVGRRALPLPGENALLIGAAGGLGSAALPLLRDAGVERVLCTAGSEESALFLERRLGVPLEDIVRYDRQPAEALAGHVLALNDGHRLPMAFDFAGGLAMKRLALDVLDFEGRLITAVEEPEGLAIEAWAATGPLFQKALSLHMVFTGARAMAGAPRDWSAYAHDLGALARLCESGRLPPPAVTVLGDLSLETVREAHRRLDAGHNRGKLVMRVT
ncbi:NADP-dependent oxidoreductase [Geminicoccaceae bacterium 1502E]|nr:NADP-dependent oxidoreductase [Geminicoccaceae bacterium 1502E]